MYSAPNISLSITDPSSLFSPSPVQFNSSEEQEGIIRRELQRRRELAEKVQLHIIHV